MSTSERVALLAYHLCCGEHFTTDEAAALVGVSRAGAWKMLTTLSGAHGFPLTADRGRWFLITERGDPLTVDEVARRARRNVSPGETLRA